MILTSVLCCNIYCNLKILIGDDFSGGSSGGGVGHIFECFLLCI